MGTISDMSTNALLGATIKGQSNISGPLSFEPDNAPPLNLGTGLNQISQAIGKNNANNNSDPNATSNAAANASGLPLPETNDGTVMSDQNLKTNIKSADKDINQLLDNVGVHQYNYKDEKDGKGLFVGPMAQQLEKTEIGKSAVIETSRGKMVDTSRLVMTSLSALAMHHQDIKKIDKDLQYLKKIITNRKK